jgi:hypothetical protein
MNGCGTKELFLSGKLFFCYFKEGHAKRRSVVWAHLDIWAFAKIRLFYEGLMGALGWRISDFIKMKLKIYG